MQKHEPVVFTELISGISYSILERSILEEPKIDPEVRRNNPERVIQIQQEYYETLKTLLNITDGIHMYTIGNRKDQCKNDYSKFFKEQIESLEINYRTHLLVIRIHPPALPLTFRIPPPITEN